MKHINLDLSLPQLSRSLIMYLFMSLFCIQASVAQLQIGVGGNIGSYNEWTVNPTIKARYELRNLELPSLRQLAYILYRQM